MLNDRRRFWTTLIFILLLAPAVITLLLTLLTPAPATRPPAGEPATGGPLTSFLSPGNASAPRTAKGDAPVLAAGDGRHVWVVHPFQLLDPPPSAPKPLAVYRLLRRAGNTGVWLQSTSYGVLWRTFPQALVVLPQANGDNAAGRPYVPGVPFVLGEGGTVERFTAETQSSVESLPAGHRVMASAGNRQGVFAVTQGPATAATRPGEPLRPLAQVTTFTDPFAHLMLTPPATGRGVGAGTAPATSPGPAAASAPASAAAPATATAPGAETRAAPPAVLNTFWLRNGRWVLLPSLGEAGGDPAVAPTGQSRVALVAQDDSGSPGEAGRLVAVWSDPTRPGELFVRGLEVGASVGGAAWSPTAVCRLPEQVPVSTRLLAVSLEGGTGVFWTVPTGSTVELRGGLLVAQSGAGPEAGGAGATSGGGYRFNGTRIAPMSLGAAGQGIRPDLDVALAVTENSLLAVVATKDNLATLVFSDRGQPMAGPTPVEVRSIAAEVQVGRNIGMIILMLVFSLTLWQWRQPSTGVAIPPGLAPAPLHLRGVAFLIDAAIPFLIVAVVFGQLGNATSMLSAWFGSSARPEELLHLPEFFTFVALYVAHGTVGELFFRKSVGKAVTGLQVLMVDGRPPTLAAVLLRNLIRLPEIAIGFVLIWILFSEHRQRVGDVLARTVVLAKQSPETPEDGDRAPRSKD